jgi:hypothetical protein
VDGKFFLGKRWRERLAFLQDSCLLVTLPRIKAALYAHNSDRTLPEYFVQNDGSVEGVSSSDGLLFNKPSVGQEGTPAVEQSLVAQQAEETRCDDPGRVTHQPHPGWGWWVGMVVAVGKWRSGVRLTASRGSGHQWCGVLLLRMFWVKKI